MTVSHQNIWSAIDALADQKKMSVSRLARSAGLDPTTFNRSKRTSSDGRERWPSMESIAKILNVTDTSIEFFSELVSGQHNGLNINGSFTRPSQSLSENKLVPLIGFAQAGDGGYFDDAGFPTGHGWDEVSFPESIGESVFALEISGDSMLPLYRDGDRIIVAPLQSLRLGDRVVVKTTQGEVLAKVLQSNSAQQVGLKSLNPEHPDRTFQRSDIDWIARIIWASQ